ncbi:cation:dicarboxylase symporter family transporter [Bosea sp. F3-2]|uniref:cation:dicarboxylate symporter family transporter n=1 Tax=Bosea sp. F3-2 TaxID=2599640 RepID=UPI0011EC4903|nr:cation:dicarboxylase symporter family transporter [Bosea sp. F3-2]QEL26199.1 cation:dicarboxylase symporter family transporter [Bosea sp. F3-2]
MMAVHAREISGKKPFYKQLYFQVLFGVLVGGFLGHFAPDFAVQFKPMGDAFIKIVKMMIVPVVFCTIVIGIATVGANASIGGALLKAMLLFYALTIIALIVGLVAVETIKPGDGMHIAASSIDPAQAAAYAKSAKKLDFVGVLLHIIPPSFFTPFAEGEVLPVLFIAIITGFGLRRVGEAGRPFLGGLESFSSGLFAAFGFLMRLAPFGAFGAIAFIVAKNGIKSIGNLGLLIATFYVASIFFVFVVLALLARFHGFSLIKLLRYIREELLVVLGTSSTEPVLPAMLYKLEKLGCSKGSVGLTLPLGYSFNLDGTAIYLTLASVFLAQALDIQLSQWQIVSMILVMLLTSKGAAGVTGSGFAALVATLAAMPDTVPVAAVVIIAGIDRFMSEARALTSLCSNAVACIVLAIWDGACDMTVLKRELDQGYMQQLDEIAEPQQIAVHV